MFADLPEELAKLEELHPKYHDSVVKAKKRDKEMVAIKNGNEGKNSNTADCAGQAM